MSATIHQLTAMRDAGVKIAVVHIDKKYLIFDNGISVNIQLYDDEDRPVFTPEEAAYYEFGDEEFGIGVVPFRLDNVDWDEWSN